MAQQEFQIKPPFIVRANFISSPSYGNLSCSEKLLAAVNEQGVIKALVRDSVQDLKQLFVFLNVSEQDVWNLPEGHILCPGLIDTHIHAPQFSYTGTATDRRLMDWLQRYTFPWESSLNNDVQLARTTYREVVRTTVAHGTTTALYFATSGEGSCKALADVVNDVGQRGIVGKVCQDRCSPEGVAESTEGSLEAAERFVRHVRATEGGRAGRVLPALAPRFVPTCTPGLLRGLGDMASRHGVHVTSHISESRDEVEFVESLHPGRRDTQILREAGLLGPKSVHAHGTQLTEAELRQIALSGAAIAHCPLSNFFFGDGVLSVDRCRALGVKVGLGTDVAGGYSPSMLSAVRNAVIANKALKIAGGAEASDFDFRHAFWLATVGSAEALGLEDKIGSLEVGRRFDAIEVDLNFGKQQGYPCIMPGSSLAENFEKWINLGDDRQIRRVWVDGQVIHQND